MLGTGNLVPAFIKTKIIHSLSKFTIMYQLTKRKFEDVETNKVFCLYMHSETHEYKLIYNSSVNSNDLANGAEINGFYISAHSGAQIKINNKKTVSLTIGQFYNLKEGEQVTHRKFTGFKKFTKC